MALFVLIAKLGVKSGLGGLSAYVGGVNMAGKLR